MAVLDVLCRVISKFILLSQCKISIQDAVIYEPPSQSVKVYTGITLCLGQSAFCLQCSRAATWQIWFHVFCRPHGVCHCFYWVLSFPLPSDSLTHSASYGHCCRIPRVCWEVKQSRTMNAFHSGYQDQATSCHDCSRSPYAIGQCVFNANPAHVPNKMVAICNEFNGKLCKNYGIFPQLHKKLDLQYIALVKILEHWNTNIFPV